jgi:two-component system cell cycle response regulator DivK
MCFEEGDQRGKQRWFVRPTPEFIRPDSSQVEEPLSPTLVNKRCSERGEPNGYGIVWFLVGHSLGISRKWSKGAKLAKILIVEDNALNIKLFCDLLAAHGHEPEAVTDSRTALDRARAFSPDLVITDIQLPHVSGLDLIRMIRNDDKLRHIPIMAVTAYSARGDEERIRAAGAQAYVSKPISVVKFAQTVDQLLGVGTEDPTGQSQESWANEGADEPGVGEPGGEEEA